MYRKPRVLGILHGGTVFQERSERGYLEPTLRDPKSIFASKLKGAPNIADIDLVELPTIDSTEMLTDHRAKMAKIIYENASSYDGFFVVQGTGSVVETAAYLTFALQNLGKPISLISAQVSIFEVRTDAINKIYAGIEVATMDYGEVVIISDPYLVRGVCSIKSDEVSYDAFSSPRVLPIGKMSVSIEPADHRIRRFEGKPSLFNDFDTNVEPVFFVSGTTTRTFAKVVDDEDIHGIGIVGVGPGDLPETIPIYPDSIRKAVSLHKPILVLAQCIKGGKSKADYRVGKWPLELGAISGGDMTIQSGIHKLMYALGLAKASGVPDSKRIDFVKKVIEKNHAGELNLGP